MKRNQNRLWCLLLSAVMLFSLASCGKGGGKSSGDPNLIKLDDYELLYKSACIMENSDGKDALVLTLDFTNTGEESSSYLWNVLESATQNGTELSITTVYTDYETLAAISDSQWEEVAPGATIEVQTAFELLDTTNKVEVSFGCSAAKAASSPLIHLPSVGRPLERAAKCRCWTGGTATGTAGG